MNHVIRLIKGQDLKQEITKYAKESNIEAGIITCCVGCVNEAKLRLADGETIMHRQEQFEIVSITGTFSKNGCHIHISLSDCDGQTIGGHLVDGCIVNTTAEICITELNDYVFTREYDESTGYAELKINHK